LSYEQRFEWGNVFGEVLRDVSATRRNRMAARAGTSGGAGG